MSIGLRLGSRLFLFFKRRFIPLWYKPVTKLCKSWDLLKLNVLTLCYNEHLDTGYVADTLLEPIFWFVDHFTAALGPVFVCMVIFFLTAFIIIAYAIGLPWWWNRSPVVTVIALILGNYLLINVVFHYYMALTTEPGQPPHDKILFEVVSICKKCLTPKPPRTHHCSVCDKCILKMDHHCPWLNNCIGHYNHRFFFLFCLYTWLGTIFVMIFGVLIAYEHFWTVEDEDVLVSPSSLDESNNSTNSSQAGSFWMKVIDHILTWRNGAVVFELMLTVGVFLAIGALGLWHAKLITKGETCVETCINKKERKKLAEQKRKFRNPFDRGPKENWKAFLGLDQPGITWRHVLLPSTHSPMDDGLRWGINP